MRRESRESCPEGEVFRGESYGFRAGPSTPSRRLGMGSVLFFRYLSSFTVLTSFSSLVAHLSLFVFSSNASFPISSPLLPLFLSCRGTPTSTSKTSCELPPLSWSEKRTLTEGERKVDGSCIFSTRQTRHLKSRGFLCPSPW